jgi:hypothetical protein
MGQAKQQQQEFMRGLIDEHGRNLTNIRRKYAEAERSGTFTRESNINNTSAEDYGELLYLDVMRRKEKGGTRVRRGGKK